MTGVRIVSPAVEEHESLRPPLTTGEREVFEFFDRLLPVDWEIYVQPFLNGLRPDFVLLNPAAGIAVFEIKDWNLEAMSYSPARGRDDAYVRVRDRNGKSFNKKNPVAQTEQYRKEIAELYLPSLLTGNGIAAVTGGVIFTAAAGADVRELLAPQIASVPKAQLPYRPVAGRDALVHDDLAAVFPEWERKRSRVMTEELAEELRRWLREPEHSREQRQPLLLDPRQRPLAENRTATGFRRIRGPAGSGKSAILARRAALLAAEGKDVLVVSYNHTLRTYLADLTVRAGGRRTAVTWLGFHEWCKSTMRRGGRSDVYGELAARLAAGDKSVLDEKIAAETLAALTEGPTQAEVPRYDAVLVDEGQDFRPSWWAALRAVLRENGEMMLVADRAQDIYETGASWTEAVMEGAGFSGPWNELAISYRMPPALTRLVADFRERFQPGCEGESPEPLAQEQLAFLGLRWRQVQAGDELDAVLEELDVVVDGGSYSDIGVMTGTREAATAIVEALKAKGIECIHTMSDDHRIERQLKHYFFRGDARVKVTPIHNFKGWEMTRIVVLLDDPNPSVAYTALSRLSANETGSALSVVCSVDAFADYGSTFHV